MGCRVEVIGCCNDDLVVDVNEVVFGACVLFFTLEYRLIFSCQFVTILLLFRPKS